MRILLILVASVSVQLTVAAETFELRDQDRVVFLGNSFFERALDHGYLELALTLRWPDKHLTFRNLGWDGDTVYGHARTGGRRRAVFGNPEEGFQRLVEHVNSLKPTVVFVAYGFNECFDGEVGLKPFRKGFQRLLRAVGEEKTRFVLVIPPLPQGEGAGIVCATLKRYGAVIREIADEGEHSVVDLMDPIRLQQGAGHFENGIHLSAFGYQQAAEAMVRQLSLPAAEDRLSSQVEESLRRAIVAKNTLYYHRWRPRNDAFVYGERKDEQKIAQTEPAKFEPFIAKQEALIRKLLKP